MRSHHSNFCISQQLCLVAVHRGVGAMEIVAMDMKVSGMYIARQLSFSGVSFRIEEIALDEEFKVVYNKAARLVSGCRLSQSEHDCAAERRSHTMTSLLGAPILRHHSISINHATTTGQIFGCFSQPS